MAQGHSHVVAQTAVASAEAWTPEVFDAHEKAFQFYKGACQRGIYDNMKTAVDAVFVGQEARNAAGVTGTQRGRQFNRRFLQMLSHHTVDPTAFTPAAGWEKGQVENQVGTLRERFFTPRLKFKSYDELNAWLLDRCVARTPVKGLDLLPSGARNPNPAEVLGRAALADMVASLRGYYDWIVCDAPPVLAVADAAILCRVADYAVVVVGAQTLS